MLRKLALTSILLAIGCLPLRAQEAGIVPCASASITATTVSSNIQLSACGGVTILWNIGTQEAFYNYGVGTATSASTSNFSIPGASFIVLNLGLSRLYLAGVTAASNTTLRITQGNAQ